MNLNSIIIYGGFAIILADAIASRSFGGAAGIITGCAIIYFILADERQRQNIRDNLLWRS